MSWFSAKKKIIVSTVVYNLAGGPEDRVKYIPSTIATKVISNTQFSMSETLQSALINGPGMRMRRYGSWARRSGYTEKLNMTSGKLSVGSSVNLNDILTQIPVDPGKVITIQSAKIDDADYGAWADQWMLENHPKRVDGDYIIDFDEASNTIFISFDDSPTVYQFNPVGFDRASPYLYISYTISDVDTLGPLITGSTVIIGSPAEFPSTADWEAGPVVSTPTDVDLATTVLTEVTYSDSTPPESNTETSTRPSTYDTIDAQYNRSVFQGASPDGSEINSISYYMHQQSTGVITPTTTTTTSEETLPDGTVKTTKVTTTVENIVSRLSYRIDEQDVIDRSWSVMHTIIYKKNSGNPVFDAMFTPTISGSSFMPFIPVRLDNRMISESYFPEIYELNKKALPRATGSKYDPVVDSLNVTPSLRDIDYAYITFGVSFNTTENTGKKYLYKFFQNMLFNAGSGESEYSEWRIKWTAANDSQVAWLNWKEAQSVPTSPLFGLPEPEKLPYPTEWGNSIAVSSSTLNFDMRVHWSSITEVVSQGLAWPDAKQGQVKIQIGASNNYDELLVSAGLVSWIPQNHEFTSIIWQDTPTSYRTLGIWNLWHVNMVYKGKAVYTSSSEAMIDPEESGFIVPMHEGIFRGMSLVDTSQMAMSSGYMVLNCYQVVKQKWYQTSWFKIILVIIVIVITVLSAGSGASSAGLLGTAASVGAALGFVGVVAIIVGTIANAVAAMLLTQLLSMGATALFGEKVGAIVGAIASVVAVSAGTTMMGGQGLAAGFSNLATAQNILKLTVAAGNGLAEYVGAETADIMKDTQDLMSQYEKESKSIADTWQKNLGMGNISIDPTMLTDSAQKYEYIPELASVFLSRTLLTGSEIAAMTNDLLTNFTKMTLSTELS